MRRFCWLLEALLLLSVVLAQDSTGLTDKDKEWLNQIYGPLLSSTSPSATTTTTTTIAPENKFNDPNLEPDFNESAVCTTDKGESGICVLLQQCVDGVIDNTTLIDLRIGSCPNYLQTCCLRSASVKVPPIPPLNNGCGWSNPGAGVFRDKDADNINRRTYADYGEYPWMVALLKASDSAEWKQSEYYGGGAIIHPSVVITAAHKVDKHLPSEIKCRAGEWDTRAVIELYPTQDRDVKKIIYHEEYYKTPAVNDLALLVLKSPFILEEAPHIGVACLAPRVPPPAGPCYSMGWGRDFLDNNKNAVILKKVELGYVEPASCQASLRRTRLGPRYSLHASHLCAGGRPGVDTCKGDGGSSLVCPIPSNNAESRFAVYGLVAFGVDCGTAVPGVYVNIPRLHSWVDTKMTEEGFGTSSYKY